MFGNTLKNQYTFCWCWIVHTLIFHFYVVEGLRRIFQHKIHAFPLVLQASPLGVNVLSTLQRCRMYHHSRWTRQSPHPTQGKLFLGCGSLISWNQAQDYTKPHQLPIPALDALLNDLCDQIELFIPSRRPYTESLPHARCCAGCLGLAGGNCCPQ